MAGLPSDSIQLCKIWGGGGRSSGFSRKLRFGSRKVSPAPGQGRSCSLCSCSTTESTIACRASRSILHRKTISSSNPPASRPNPSSSRPLLVMSSAFRTSPRKYFARSCAQSMESTERGTQSSSGLLWSVPIGRYQHKKSSGGRFVSNGDRGKAPPFCEPRGLSGPPNSC